MYPNNTPEELTLIKSNSDNPDFAILIKDLDANLQSRNGDMQEFFNQFNKVDQIKHVIVAYLNKVPAGCGAIKRYDNDAAEVKRMFVGEEYRGKGIAGKILTELENWAKELGYTHTILETSKTQYEAVALYTKKGYSVIDNYGQYKGIENSICFKKEL
jgi:putative acetyltransferase